MTVWDGTVFRFTNGDVWIECINPENGKIRYIEAPKKDWNGKRLRSKDRCEIEGDRIFKKKPLKFSKKEWEAYYKQLQENLKDL